MSAGQTFTLSRDCPSIQIPSGESLLLPKGTQGAIMQSLGGTYTVTTDRGMVRIDGRDADAMGLEVQENVKTETPVAENPEQVEQQVWEKLKTVYDPEVPVNVVDLGLVYGCVVKPVESGAYRVEIKLTLTAPGCGMGDVLRRDAQVRVEEIGGVKEATVELVLEPPWDKSKMSEGAKLQLGMF